MKTIFKLSKSAILLAMFFYAAGVFAFTFMYGFHWPWNETVPAESLFNKWVNDMFVAGLMGYYFTVSGLHKKYKAQIKHLKFLLRVTEASLDEEYDNHLNTLDMSTSLNERNVRLKKTVDTLKTTGAAWLERYRAEKTRAGLLEDELNKLRYDTIIDRQAEEIGSLKIALEEFEDVLTGCSDKVILMPEGGVE